MKILAILIIEHGFSLSPLNHQYLSIEISTLESKKIKFDENRYMKIRREIYLLEFSFSRNALGSVWHLSCTFRTERSKKGGRKIDLSNEGDFENRWPNFREQKFEFENARKFEMEERDGYSYKAYFYTVFL